MLGVTSRRRRNETKVKEKQQSALVLYELLEEEHLVKVCNAFRAASDRRMDKEELATSLFKIANITYPESEFQLIFFRMNTKRNGFVTWDEFISYLIIEFNQKEIPTEYQSLDAPISKSPRILRSHHRHPVSRITFSPTIKNDGTYSYCEGNYLTVSKDGCINYWTVDLKLDRTEQSSCPDLKVQTTWILDTVCLPDVNVVCTASSERDLRFYDTTARKFELRVMITSFNYAVVSLYYDFNMNDQQESKLIFGDMGGNVKILSFCPVARGPFKSQPGIPLLRIRYELLIKGQTGGFLLTEFRNIHTDWVRQVSYYRSLNSIVSCSSCPKVGASITDNKTNYQYKIPKGAWCFAVCETVHIFVTGGPDSIIRVWNPFVPSKPSAIFTGHHAGICNLILQNSGTKLFSISKDKCIKVWDVMGQTCLQTYLDVPPELGEYSDFTSFYNPSNRQFLIGCIKIIVLEFCPLQSGEHTDGNTHFLPVSIVLYNTLFKVIITCGLDSFIIVWNPWTGKRISVIRDAHTRLLHGELIPVEITAAAFDPGNQLLLTGANNGSLKMWNFNTSTCLQNMSIEPECEVTSIVWMESRILVIGWNRHVTEFSDTGGVGASKSWDTRHTEDVFCATANIPQTLATSTYNGELLLWRLETGQPYKRYNVVNPTGRITIEYKINKQEKKWIGSNPNSSNRISGTVSSFSKKFGVSKKISSIPSVQVDIELASPEARVKRLGLMNVPETCVPLRDLAVYCMIFLNSRPMEVGVATLLVAVENGTVQAWSHHPSGSFLTAFQAVHRPADYVVAMTTDEKNEFLFTGTLTGYIKVWLMVDYFPSEPVKVCMPKYRLLFPFLWKDLIDGRAKRATKGQPKPLLLSSYKGHMLPVSGMCYLNDAKILASFSLAKLCHYQKKKNNKKSLKVFTRGLYQKEKRRQTEDEENKTIVQVNFTNANIYGKKLEEPILGNHFKIPERDTGRYKITLDTSFPYTPVYTHLIMQPPKEVPRPSTPEGIIVLRGKKEENTNIF
ncbi:hypothetical protein FQA39_LY14440 [Lamprigera yunnana]|nr:hypothetical protein FQA39_LY14440 [Lamprigera yunnana]